MGPSKTIHSRCNSLIFHWTMILGGELHHKYQQRFCTWVKLSSCFHYPRNLSILIELAKFLILQMYTLPKTNIAPKYQCLEDDKILGGMADFQGPAVSFKEGMLNPRIPATFTTTWCSKWLGGGIRHLALLATACPTPPKKTRGWCQWTQYTQHSEKKK